MTATCLGRTSLLTMYDQSVCWEYTGVVLVEDDVGLDTEEPDWNRKIPKVSKPMARHTYHPTKKRKKRRK